MIVKDCKVCDSFLHVQMRVKGVKTMYDNPSGNETVRCSFCGKTQEEVKNRSRSGVYICNECIDLCKEIIDEEFYEEAVREFTEVPKPAEIFRCLK